LRLNGAHVFELVNFGRLVRSKHDSTRLRAGSCVSLQRLIRIIRFIVKLDDFGNTECACQQAEGVWFTFL
jgi:hypothetical protein